MHSEYRSSRPGRKAFVLCCWLWAVLVAPCSFAQAGLVSVTGVVQDSASHQPVPQATITLLQGKNGKHTVTGDQGSYQFRVSPGAYLLRVESVGYRREEKSVRVGAASGPVALPVIMLAPAVVGLSAVTVTGQKKLIENKLDRIVFNAENDLTSQGGVATDLLKKIPQVTVDVDGNVELGGTGSIRFLINGKPSTSFGSNVADVLQSIPASQIRQIEVMTVPGVKYDAQGMGGVINIILKQNPQRGFNTSLSLTGGTRMENGTLNLNARTDKFSLSAFTGLNTRLPAQTTTTSQKISTDSLGNQTILNQYQQARFSRFGSESGLSGSFTPDSLNTLSFEVHYNLFGNKTTGTIDQQQFLAQNAMAGLANTNHSFSQFRFTAFDYNVSYRRLFHKAGEQLDIAYNRSNGHSQNRSSYVQYALPDNQFISGNNSSGPGKARENEITLDFTTPLGGGIRWGSGAKLETNQIVSSVSAFSQSANGQLTPDANLNNHLTYHQTIYAAYSEVEVPWKKVLQLKGGLRYEHTMVNGNYFTPSLARINLNYNTWVPSIYISRNLSEQDQLKLGYTRRIERPDLGDLNPFVNTSDPSNLVTGNPALTPEKGERVELTFSHDFKRTGSAALTLFYRGNQDDIQPYVTYYSQYQVGDTVYKNVSVSRRENIGIEKNIGFNFYGDVSFWSKLTVRGNLFVFRRFTTNKIDKGLNIQSNNYRAELNVAYKFSPTLAGEFFGDFRSARNEVQGRYPSFTTYSFAVRKQFWKNKASLALSLINPFNEYIRQETALFGPNFTMNSVRKIPFRSVGLNFTWRFGHLEFRKEQQADNPLPGIE